jgi:hypothetical protein
MKLTWLKWSALPAAVLLAGSVAVAQSQSSPSSSSSSSQGSGSSTSSTASSTPAKKPTIQQRKENQQDRIAQGVKSGQLTAGETAKLEHQQKNINQQERADRAANGGKLNAADRKQINKEQNRASKNIYDKKHNDKTQPGTKPN